MYNISVDHLTTQISYKLHNEHSSTFWIPNPIFAASEPLESLVTYSNGSVSFNEDTAILSYDATFYDFSSGKDVVGKVSYIYVK